MFYNLEEGAKQFDIWLAQNATNNAQNQLNKE